MKYFYWMRSRGIGGRIESPEDFFVREMLHRKYFARYKTKEGKVARQEGKYNLFLLRKRNMTTHDAIKLISQRFRNNNIGFAGLKDKFAVTEQYVTMSGGEDFKEGSLEISKAGTTDKMLSKGDLIGNAFVITLHGCRDIENLPKLVSEINRRGVPNYFGPQRFGAHANNHIIGRLLVRRNFSKALRLINKSYKRDYRDIFHVPKEKLKFFINAYQSRLFNEMLNGYVKKGKYFSGYLPIIGYNTKAAGKAGKIMKAEGIIPRDFMLERLACAGGRRKAFIKTCIEYTISGRVRLHFTLPSGSYGTVVLREICKTM